MTLPNSSLDLGATITWLTEGARSASTPQDVVHQLCSQLTAAGLAIDRCAVFVSTLHPAIMARRFLWNPGQDVQINEANYELQESDTFKTSSVPVVMRTGKAIRRHLAAEDCPDDYNIIDELRAEGFTDYIIHPLDFLNGQHHAISWATKKAGGFSDEDITALLAVQAPLARIAEIYALRRTAGNLLDTYVGHRTGQRILDGKIRRGDVEAIDAAILVADLRGFTTISNSRPATEVVGILNAYYDCLVPAIEAHGGEILKFMGDGLLAIFPIEEDQRIVCDAALQAAEEGLQQLSQHADGAYRCGMALHLGAVLYGNIGSQSRLDFTAIGPAVNLTARLEPLTRDLARPIVTSAAFADTCAAPIEKLGVFSLRGFDGHTEVFAPAERSGT
ncbi:MAG: adenylate/guanylate cyclase domain-containing protein [Alphaproteobacteria bacterium]|nr:adenylate/guanylate cyclase domain-containing protein [Alphaproteobacteria bacterium]